MLSSSLLKTVSRVYVGFSALALGSVALMALVNPQSVMDLAQVTLPNTDAYSSIRGVYGGVGLALVVLLIRLLFIHLTGALRFLTLFWGMYAVSRLITWAVDGPLGAFGTQWLVIELTLSVLGGLLVYLHRRV